MGQGNRVRTWLARFSLLVSSTVMLATEDPYMDGTRADGGNLAADEPSTEPQFQFVSQSASAAVSLEAETSRIMALGFQGPAIDYPEASQAYFYLFVHPGGSPDKLRVELRRSRPTADPAPTLQSASPDSPDTLVFYASLLCTPPVPTDGGACSDEFLLTIDRTSAEPLTVDIEVSAFVGWPAADDTRFASSDVVIHLEDAP